MVSASSSSKTADPQIPLDPFLSEETAIYRYDESALSWREYRSLHPRTTWIGYCWQRATGTFSRKDSHIVHIKDHSAFEIGLQELRDEGEASLLAALEQFAALDFAEGHATRHVDPFNLLETVALFAAHSTADTVLRISLTRNLRGLVPMQLQICLFSVFPDGSALVTENASPKLSSPEGERRQGSENAEPATLSKMHFDVLNGIPHQPKPVTCAVEMWDVANALSASLLRFNLARGLYRERTSEECAADEASLRNSGGSSDNEAQWSAAAPGSLRGPLPAIAWLAAILAFLATIFFATTGSRQRTVEVSATPIEAKKPAEAVKPKVQPRFASTLAPKLRDAE